MEYKRKDNELPLATTEWGWRYHHLGIPTNVVKENEKGLEGYNLYFCGFETSPYGIEWMRFEENCPVPELIKKVPHIAFEVDNLDIELEKRNFNILTPPNSPSDGVRVAMIEHNGAPIELIEFKRK